MLDTSSFGWIKQRIFDNEKFSKQNSEDYRFSSPYMNDLRVLIHNKEDIREAKEIQLKYDEPSNFYQSKQIQYWLVQNKEDFKICGQKTETEGLRCLPVLVQDDVGIYGFNSGEIGNIEVSYLLT